MLIKPSIFLILCMSLSVQAKECVEYDPSVTGSLFQAQVELKSRFTAFKEVSISGNEQLSSFKGKSEYDSIIVRVENGAIPALDMAHKTINRKVYLCAKAK